MLNALSNLAIPNAPNAKLNTNFVRSRLPVVIDGDWILDGGIWNDAGVWNNTENWSDAA